MLAKKEKLLLLKAMKYHKYGREVFPPSIKSSGLQMTDNHMRHAI
jgi:hypothetical protein